MSTSTASLATAPRRVTVRVTGLADRALIRWGPHYLHVLLGIAGGLLVLVGVPLQTITQLPLWTGGFEPLSYAALFAAIAAACGLPLTLLSRLPTAARLVAHLRGEPVAPVEVWEACVVSLPRTAAAVTGGWSLAASAIGLSVVGPREDFDLAAYVGAFLAQTLAAAGLAAFSLMFFRLAFLPIVREVAARLPKDFAERSPVDGRQRLILLNTAITFTVGCQAAGLSTGLMHQGRPWVVVAVTIGIVSTYVGLFLTLVTSSVTRKVDELADALKVVANGAGTMRILPTSGDELDETGRAFNTMLDLLEDHAKDLRQSRARLVDVADGTRRRIERDLHDGAQQNLALVSMQLGQLESVSARLPGVAFRVQEIRSELAAVIGEMRALAHGIYPAALEAEGLGSALRAAARESEIPVRLDLSLASRWPHPVETAVYFCCWEALQRAGHGGPDHAPTVRITLTERTGTGELLIAIDPPLAPLHAADLALFLADRLGAVGGSSSAVPELGESTVLRGEVPTR